jgi:pyrimidine deaminase RibD-like protein
MVGSVIVYEDRIIGKAGIKKAGEPHAEVNAVIQ